jgi:hypothetical protein
MLEPYPHEWPRHATEEGAGVQQFRKLGELVFCNVCPWVSRELAANMLTR